MGEIPLLKLKQEAREYIAKCDAEHGTGGMDIKERIDALSEQDAKAALLWAIEDIAGYRSAGVDFCVPCYEISEKQKNVTLDKVLKETQK